MAMLIWILNIFTGFIGPLIIWIMKKDESEYINRQGKNYLNFAISYTSYIIVSWILTIVLIGYIPLFILSIAGFVYALLVLSQLIKMKILLYLLQLKLLNNKRY
ncbi:MULTISPECIES: DUF4870 domain-containing protein [Staphylococcus]|uniref:DUF4870 domain-containing protein n=1 Tax=Staphylococcus sp. GDY8P94P TaxID=2804144 RepID=UPI001F339226|nr:MULTISPECIES: DUF4870 domain-containing protein [Staphylococcus]